MHKGLIVDSAKDMAQVMGEFLHGHGFHLEHVEKGVEALDRFRGRLYDFLIISNRTAGMDSQVLVQKLLNLQPKVLPIFLGSHKFSKEGIIYIQAPFKLDEVLNAIRARMSQS